ncbi:MAG: LEA type 2 family protein [Bacteroidia bacterium]|nr:LEA type 2 family protein [Bacteroidia bacterium]
MKKTLSNSQNLFSLILFCLLLTLFSCDQVKEPEFQTMKDLKFNSVNLKGDLRLTAKAVFSNPNPVGIKISGMDLNVDIEGHEAAHVVQQVASEMKPNADFSLPLTIDIPIEKVVVNLKDTVTSIFKKKKYKVEMEGTIQVELLGAQVDVPFEYEEETELPLKPI